jgi:GT2 family glycosyltransferase
MCSEDFALDIYLTDDGSTDGTAEEVIKLFPEVTVIKGDGNLFWAEGMRRSWSKALENPYDGFLLLNDDVEIYDNVFDQLLAAHEYSLKAHNRPGIYIGPTEDKQLGRLTYSGSLILNKFLYTHKRLQPNGSFQKCDLANANILMVSNAVVQEMGIFPEGYAHGSADYDYTLTASRKGIPVIVSREYCGHCEYDHGDKYENFENISFQERKKILNNPTGFAFSSRKKFMKKFFPVRYPFFVFFGYFKLYFPRFYKKVILSGRR